MQKNSLGKLNKLINNDKITSTKAQQNKQHTYKHASSCHPVLELSFLSLFTFQ